MTKLASIGDFLSDAMVHRLATRSQKLLRHPASQPTRFCRTPFGCLPTTRW